MLFGSLLFGREWEYVFQTDLTIDDCVSRLKKANINLGRLAWYFGWSPSWRGIVGRVEGSTFRILEATNFRSHFRPIFYGKLMKAGLGTRISGHFGVRTVDRAIMIYYYVMLTLFVMLGAFNLASGVSEFAHLALFIVAPIVIWLLDTSARRSEQRHVLKFLQTTLQAAPVSSAESET